MNPLRKSFPSGSTFPFELVYRDRKTYQSELPDHLHDWCELIYVHGGRGSFFIDQTFYDMRPGDLFLIPENTIHRAFPDRDDPVTSTALFFRPSLVQSPDLPDGFTFLQCFEESRLAQSYKMECRGPLLLRLEDSLASMHGELSQRRPGYLHAVWLQLQLLLFTLGRERAAASAPSRGAAVHGAGWIQEALQTIDRDPGAELGLAALSRKAAVSPAHFSREFKRLTGMNVTAYVTAKRLIRVMELLRTTGRSVNEIAAGTGFDSLPHFYRVFKKATGLTPAEYRAKERSPS